MEMNNDLQGINTAKIVMDSPNVVCECGCKTFIPAVLLKKVSALVSPTGNEELIDIPVYVCSKCGKIPQVYRNKPNFDKIYGEDTENKIKM